MISSRCRIYDGVSSERDINMFYLILSTLWPYYSDLTLQNWNVKLLRYLLRIICILILSHDSNKKLPCRMFVILIIDENRSILCVYSSVVV